jgi:hypothetical protein
MNDSNLHRPIHGGRNLGDECEKPRADVGMISTANECAVTAPKQEDDGRIGPHALQLAAQAWCEPDTSNRVMDPALCYAFARILERELRKPWLGNATTRQLLEEVRTRTEVDGSASYRTRR